MATPTAAVPEPASIALMLWGGLALWARCPEPLAHGVTAA